MFIIVFLYIPFVYRICTYILFIFFYTYIYIYVEDTDSSHRQPYSPCRCGRHLDVVARLRRIFPKALTKRDH